MNEDLFSLVMNSPDTFYRADLEGTLLFISPAVEKLLGYSVAELIGTQLADLYVDQELRQHFLQQLKDTGGQLTGFRAPLRHKDGGSVWVTTSATYHYAPDGKVLGVEGCVHNTTSEQQLMEERARYLESLESVVKKRTIELQKEITEHHQTEAELREKTTMLDNVLRSAQAVAIVTTDLDFRITYYNPMAEKFFGYSSIEVVGKTVMEMHLKENVSVDRLERALAIVGREGKFRYSVTQNLNNGMTREIDSTVSGIFDPDGRLVGYSLFAYDVTEKFNLKEQLQQSQKMEAIGTLAGGVAHDFNNILTVIQGHAQLAMLQTTSENPLWNDLVEIDKAGGRASKLTRQLLVFSRKQRINPEPLLINPLVKDLGKMLKRLIGEDITLKLELGEKLAPVFADPGQLEQVLINLVVNAADAVKGQPLAFGRKITVSTAQIFLDRDFLVSHADCSAGWYLLLEVSDNGCGIPTAVLEHVFEPFYTTKAVGKGTGLGLSTVYGIVKQNHAAIAVESEPDQGTTFKIYWPSSKDDRPQTIEKEKLEPAPGGSEVILLVEDEVSARNLGQQILQQAGYSVIAAENGRDALAKVKDYTGPAIDLLFTDVVMPLMGGLELCEKMTTIYPRIKVLFASGYPGDRVNRDNELFKRGRFIDKPYDVAVLLKKIRQIMDDQSPD